MKGNVVITTVRPSAAERVRECVCSPENGAPESLWGMVFEIDAVEIARNAYQDGATAERAAIVAWLRKEEDNFCPVYCLAGSGEITELIERGEHKQPA
jgi:hypothetical protein